MGMGYIGLPTAVLLANQGYQVHGVDINQKTIEIINRGETHIVEPELNKFVYSAIRSGSFKVNIKPAEADIFIIAVPTPFYEDKLNKLTNSPIPNVNYIVEATKQIASFVKSGNLILLESTSPVGTTDMVSEILKKEGVDTSGIYIAHSHYAYFFITFHIIRFLEHLKFFLWRYHFRMDCEFCSFSHIHFYHLLVFEPL